MEGIISNLLVNTFHEKGFGRVEGMHKTEKGISFPFLPIFEFLKLTYVLLLFLFVILIKVTE